MNLTLPEIADFLARTPQTIRALVESLPPRLAAADYGPATFSPTDVVGHLIFGEMTDWVPRARLILDHGEARPFTPFDRQGHSAMVRAHPLAWLLDEFARLRAENVAWLRGARLSDADLARRGTHPELGAVTMGELLNMWVAHDLSHIAQIGRACVWNLRDAIGPWTAYSRLIEETRRQQEGLGAFEYAVLVRAPRPRVFDAMTTAEGLDAWFTTGATVERRKGGFLHFRWRNWGPDRVTTEDRATIAAWEPPGRVEFVWHPGAAEMPISVTMTFEERAPDATVVRVRETGYRDADAARRTQLECAGGWGEALTLMKMWVEHGVRS